MNTFTTVAIGIAGGLALLAGIGWAGLQVKPANLPLPADEPQNLGAVATPTEVSMELPAPVHCFYRTAYGDQVPLVESLAVYGRARANFGIWLPPGAPARPGI